MNKLGLVGGIGPASTIEYYRLAFAEYRSRVTDGSAPPIVIDSIDVNLMLNMIGKGKLQEVTEYLLDSVRNLANAGANFGLMAAHTPHIVFDAIAQASPIPLISVVRTACNAVAGAGMTRVSLFGTRFTMSGQFYPAVFSKSGISIVPPLARDQEEIHHIYTTELINGVVVPESRSRLVTIARRLRQDQDVQAVILAGTELPPALRECSDASLQFLDASTIHVRAAIDRMLES